MFTILLYAFIAITSIQLIYFLLIFSRFSFAKKKKTKQNNIPISVLICAKNEAKNLKTFLPSIINQKHTNFEIILINDASYDDTLEVMESFQEKHPNIKIVNVENNEAFWGSKKYALTLGIKASTNDYLLLTDADCTPKSDQWISSMGAHFSENKKIVLGYGAYKKKKHSILNTLIRFETLLTAIQYFSYAKVGNPYMGVGRNLAYHKTEFFNVNGFMNHMDVRSGDDDLFVNQVATKKNTSIEFSEESHTLSNPSKTFSEWFTQKRRHVSTASHYKGKDQFFLGLFYVSQILFWFLFIVLISLLFQWKLVLLIFGIRILFQYLVYGLSAKKLKEQDLIFAIPFLELFLILFQLTIFITNRFSKPNHWN
ncbi:MAG: glycosyl transferase family 2 [Kordia sp.]|nr:MAG: glycosyl transferase family 2 [Kordia sp.]